MATEEQSGSVELPEHSGILSLEDLKPAMDEVFEGEHERQWAAACWSALIDLGFASYSNELERCEAAINFIAFAEFYRDCKAITEDDSYRGLGYGDLPNALNLGPFRLGLLMGQQPGSMEEAARHSDLDWDSDSDLFGAALFHLESKARPKIVSALEQYHRGQTGLFVALWNSDKKPRPADYDENRQEYDYALDIVMGELRIWQPAYQENDAEILNDATDEKLRLWTWLDQGAEPLDRC